ncbi:MAG: ATP-dependent helicase, partial [Actinomycetota bacterium]
MNQEQISAGLNPEQRRAVEAVRGPVVILAGAGSGKTTTITRRIANQVLSGAFQPGEILAVTFTDNAVGEMRGRLERLGVQGVKARTFHSAALAQLRNLAENPPGQILASKAGPLRQLANSLPAPYRFRPSADLANEIEWAKNRRLTPDTYAGSLGDHEPPIPVDLMQPIFRRYEERKNDQGLMDFEDILGLTIQMFDRDEYATERFRARYAAFTVDEYQDVNLLQQSLLDRWLGPRDDVCAVGDDYQSIYSFTGASPTYLLGMPRRWPRATVVRLEENYRSTPEVLDVANRLVPNLGGAEKTLRPARASGPQAVTKWLVDAHAESLFVVERVKELQRAGIPLEEMAVIYRANFRSEDFEEAFSSAGIAFQVRDGAFLNRIAA